MATVTPGPHTHEQWLGLVQPVGLVVAPAVLSALQLFPNQSTPYLSARQRQLEALLEEVDGPSGQPLQVVPSFAALATELLDWVEADLVPFEQLTARTDGSLPEVRLAEYGETLRPTHGVPAFEVAGEGAGEGSEAGSKLQALVLDLTQWHNASGKPDPQWGLDIDKPWNPTGNGWDATPQQRFERLLKETEIPIGLLFNGATLRLIHAPRGESSGYITLPLEPMAEVAGRPMLGALELLLGVDRLFGGNPGQRLPALLVASRKNQNEVSTRLAEQVLEALWELLLGFDEAERVARDAGGTVLGDLPNSEEGQKHLYGGLITVLLRLVFLLYAEDEALMPADSLYGQHYSVSALADRLRQERFEHQNAMADRRGAWASLLSLFRLVYDGGGADPAYLPARHGELFDPDAYPFLEGRAADSGYRDGVLSDVPAISDDVVEKVLTRLLWLADETKVAQRLNYRSLDVEQIGSVYEGIMGFTVEGAQGPSVGITYRPSRQKITITVVVDAEQLLAVSGGRREKWLDEQAGVALKLPAKVKAALKDATSLAELCLALDKRLSPHTPRGLQPGSLILQPTAERRRSGSHYTPRALTEPIVAEAFRPWLERCEHQPTAEQILALKVCDPAMGSGAFLVAVCRFLAAWLVQAWERDGYPEGFRQEWDKDTVARRLIAQRCLYGVDKNPFAVNLAKLSLWLVTLSKDLPFTFVDHALKCGDSLVGYSVQEIRAAMSQVQLGFLDAQNRIYEQMGIDRRESFAFDSLVDEDYDNKKQLLEKQIQATEGLRQAGDLMVAAFFAKSKPKERAEKQQVYLAMLSGAFQDDGLAESVKEIRERLASGEKGITPFHWDLEFPEVFSDGRGGFDAFVGNPPFLGGKKISTAFGSSYKDWLQEKTLDGNANADLVAYFLRQAHSLINKNGGWTLITTNSARQGDTRRAGLEWILNQGGCLFSAKRRVRWPGVAAVVVSIISATKREASVQRYIDSRPVEKITSYLLDKGGNRSPEKLARNCGTSNIGCYINGMGFTFEDSDDSSLDVPGTPTPISELKRLESVNPRIMDVVSPYIGGDEINGSPKDLCRRSVINFRDLSQHECESEWPELMSIVRLKVKPHRDTLKRDVYRTKWWQFAEKQLSLQKLQAQKKNVIAIPRVAMYYAPSLLTSDYIYSEGVAVFPVDTACELAPLFSQVHECWFSFFASTFGSADVPRYSPSEIFETFALPLEAKDLGDPIARLLEARSNAISSSIDGLTEMYSLFHSPEEDGLVIRELRDSHCSLDSQVLLSYGWDDVPTDWGFGLDDLDIDEEAQLPDGLQKRIDEGKFFFKDPIEALDFQGQLRAYGAMKPRKKLPWRYRWSDDVRDEVLARLLALNAERYEEEVRLGLHSKAGKQAAVSRSRTLSTKTVMSGALHTDSGIRQIGLEL